MPELFIEPLTDRQTCFICQKTVTGSTKLSKCAGCHAITYCGRECQRADWPRHAWNCVPVMVTEIPGKGRGIVAAKRIKKGDLIFIDKPALKLPDNMGLPAGPMESLNKQIKNLPKEAKSQFYKLTAPDTDPEKNAFVMALAKRNERDSETLKLFMANALRNRKRSFVSVYLNLSLVNHACAPNAVQGEIRPESEFEDHVPHCELRAIQDIARGEEINTCYVNNIKRFGSRLQQRRAGILEELTFDCACSVCTGQVADQEEILRRLARLHLQLNPLHPTEIVIGFEKWEARAQEKIVDLTMGLYIGKVDDKIRALDVMVRTAQLARDQNLVTKGMNLWKQLATDTNLADVQMSYQVMENSLSQWSEELKSRRSPSCREIDFFLEISYYD